MTIKTYQSPDWEVITTERRKALEAVADAAEIMVKAEFKDVKSLKGGMELWYKRGYPTTNELDVNYPYEERPLNPDFTI